ncbi:MGMT family protein [Collinsella sp. zg1085]|uniref:MGMT family protein n=1 Tax=Collinsella sp. zg1085 TaxID=2844380 RepID=UPI001C0B608F|nr:MGMT family protein [Collinsella sp. zg1085]QWT17206.1 MGMT family protein [Collinsella sp. zg1085]
MRSGNSQESQRTGFFERVYEIVEQIPPGMVASYGQVARLIGEPRKARFVGFALHVNPRPDEIPCHRVVFADGRLADGFAFGGQEAQRQLLEDEGVPFTDDGRVDLSRGQWPAGIEQ